MADAVSVAASIGRLFDVGTSNVWRISLSTARGRDKQVIVPLPPSLLTTPVRIRPKNSPR